MHTHYHASPCKHTIMPHHIYILPCITIYTYYVPHHVYKLPCLIMHTHYLTSPCTHTTTPHHVHTLPCLTMYTHYDALPCIHTLPCLTMYTYYHASPCTHTTMAYRVHSLAPVMLSRTSGMTSSPFSFLLAVTSPVSCIT